MRTTRACTTCSGVTKAGGNNLTFETYQKAADFWVQHFGDYVRNTTTMELFVAGLRKAGYNSVNPNYDRELTRQLATVRKFRAACKPQ